MHPFALAARLNKAGTPQIRKVTGNLRLIRTENFHKVANANLSIGNQVQ